MSKMILIDGYNLLKSIFPQEGPVDQLQRRRFIAELCRYQRLKGKILMLFFDGCPPDGPRRYAVGDVTIVYAGPDADADQMIRDYVRAHPERKDAMLLVSSDRALCNWVRTRGVLSVRSEFFHVVLQQSLASGGAHSLSMSPKGDIIKKISSQSCPLTDTLMQEAAQHLEIKDEQAVESLLVNRRARACGKESKRARKRRRIISKL